MILAWLILILLIGGVAAWLAGRWTAALAPVIALLATALDLALALLLWARYWPELTIHHPGIWLLELSAPWIPQLGISVHLGLDGLSLLLIVLTMLIGVIAVFVSWNQIHHRAGFYYFNLLWVLAGITGVFLALDLFLFYSFWELMLIPMALLIVIWGYERRIYAAIKFFIFTQLSGLLMLIAIVALALAHHQRAGVLTFDLPALMGTPLGERAAFWIMLGFFTAFAVKMPVVPLHNWLPDAHTEAPTAGSVILAALLLKTGAYGLFRFVLPLFPEASRAFAPTAMALGVIGIIYGAVMAFAQTDLKRLVAYTSVSHMGFALLGIYALNPIAFQGAVMVMVSHAFSTGALFIIVGAIQHRLHTRDLARMGGFWALAPRMAGAGLFFAIASLGLPGLGNFIAEFLVLTGSFAASPLATALAALGLVLAAVYSLWIVQRVFHGPLPATLSAGAAPSASMTPHLRDFNFAEMAVLAVMMAALVVLGLYPRPVLATGNAALARVERLINAAPPPMINSAFREDGR